MMLLKDKPGEPSDRPVWKWRRGQATPKADFGAPLSITDYELCIYDDGDLVARACAPADNACDGRPCWRETGRGYKFRRRDISGSGLKNSLQIILKEGAEGKASIAVKGKGGSADIPTLPLTQPVTVQLLNGGGACWVARYSAPALRNDTSQFKDKGD